MVITESDTILQEYYITRKYKSTIHEEIYMTKAERCSRAARGASRAKQERNREEELGDVQTSAAFRSPWKDPLRTLISYSKATKVRALGSGHENTGLSDATPRVHMIKPSGVHARQSHVCMIKCCGLGMQVQAITSNMNNSKSCILISLNQKACIENGMENIGAHKHEINTLNMQEIQVWTKLIVQARLWIHEIDTSRR